MLFKKEDVRSKKNRINAYREKYFYQILWRLDLLSKMKKKCFYIF